jgi:hypothetical protein
MKKLLIAASITGLTAACFGQGVVDFGNYNTANGPLIVIGSTPVASGTINVALYWASAGTVGMTTANSTLVTTLTGAQVNSGLDGYFEETAPQVIANQTGADNGSVSAEFIVQAWVGGSSYATATDHGTSVEFSSPVGPGGSDPTEFAFNNWETAQGADFVLTPTAPEPATLAVAGFGAASLLLFRRKK